MRRRLPQIPQSECDHIRLPAGDGQGGFLSVNLEIKDLSDLESGVDDEERLLSGERITDLEEELRITRENLQATIEELETANEELQSTNEELVAANEELQSTNEELQSVNEELYTVNSEYQSKLDEMTHVNMDMDNLLNNVEVGALYLDDQFRIRKITPMIPRITHIMDVDVGRPISHLSLMDTYPNWKEDIQEVFRTRQPLDREISEPGGGSGWCASALPDGLQCGGGHHYDLCGGHGAAHDEEFHLCKRRAFVLAERKFPGAAVEIPDGYSSVHHLQDRRL